MAVLQYNALINTVATTATSGGTTTLVNTSATIQVFTGSASQTIILPVATTFTEPGISYQLINQSTSSIQVNYQDSTTFKTVPAGLSLIVNCVSNGTANGSWSALLSGIIYSFDDSLINTGGTVSLVNDNASPSALSYYGTNASSVLGYNALPVLRTINPQTGTTYTFALADGSGNATNALVTFGSSSATTVTVPPNSGVAFPVGTQIDCLQVGTGTVTFSPGAGVTLNSSTGLVIGDQYAGVSLVQLSANNWVVLGLLTS